MESNNFLHNTVCPECMELLDKVLAEGEEGETSGNVVHKNDTAINSILLSLLDDQMMELQQLCHKVQRQHSAQRRGLELMNQSINKLLQAPACRMLAVAESRPTSNVGDDRMSDTAHLMSHPRTLCVLWQEWMVGVAGNKPARLFIRAKRGRAKFRYCIRKVFWDKVVEMMAAGHTNVTAIDKIYEIYGNKDISYILVAMSKDRRNGWPDSIKVN